MADEAKKKEIQKLLAGYIELKAKKDHERTLLNEIKIDVQWRDLLREAKVKDLQRDLELMKISFIKAADYKDAIISSLQDEIEQVEVKNMWTACNHMQAVDKLIGIEHERSERLRNIYEKDLNELKNHYENAKKDMEHKFVDEKTWYDDVEYIEKTVFKTFIEKTNTDFTLKQKHIDEEISKEKENMEDDFDVSILEIWKKFQLALVKYMEDAHAMENIFMSLKKEYEDSMAEIQQERKTTENLCSTIPKLKAQITEREKSHKEQIERILLEQEDFYGSAGDLMKKISKQEKQDKKLLLELVINSNNAIQELEKFVAKGEKIMKLHERCEKLEAEIGKIPSDEPMLTKEEIQLAEKGLDFDLPSDLQMDEDCKYIACLEHLWKRHNSVVLRNLALKKELSELELINKKRQSEVNRFIQDVSNKEKKYQIASTRVLNKSKLPAVQGSALMSKKLSGAQARKF